MKKILLLFLFLFSLNLFSQKQNTNFNGEFILSPELLIGISAPSNENYPSRNLQSQFILNFKWDQTNNSQEWATRLKGPKTGISIGYTNFGNKDSLGSAISVLPILEFKAFKNKNINILVGLGASYFTKKFDPVTNPRNMGITTDFTWSYKTFIYYTLIKNKNLNGRVGLGYFHHSNGHTQLPNQGVNSFLTSFTADINTSKSFSKNTLKPMDYDNSKYSYFDFSSAIGINTLSLAFNDKNYVYGMAGEYGRVYNNTWKLGIGAYYRFYEAYYNYINDNESLVQDGREFDSLKKAPVWNSSGLGIYLKGEVLLNHISIDAQLGFNIHKPAYKIDWRINEGWDFIPREIPEDNNFVLGEFDTKYKMKQYISTRLGIRYYLIGTHKIKRNNLYAGLHIYTNLGQADFSALSLGYVYSFIK